MFIQSVPRPNENSFKCVTMGKSLGTVGLKKKKYHYITVIKFRRRECKRNSSGASGKAVVAMSEFQWEKKKQKKVLLLSVKLYYRFPVKLFVLFVSNKTPKNPYRTNSNSEQTPRKYSSLHVFSSRGFHVVFNLT